MQQKATHEAIKSDTGEKHKPNTKPKHIEFGNDDCGEDLLSIAWVTDITCPFDFGAPVFLPQEHTLGEEHRDPEHEAFRVQMEAEMNPRNWLHSSDCLNFNPYSQAKAVQYEDIC
eukprot:5688804-Prorocentrum_lima.AAC.1